MGSNTSTRGAPSVLFELLQIEWFVVWISSKTAIHGMARVAHCYFAHEEIDQKIDESGQAERGHRPNRLAFCKKIQTGRNAYGDDSDPGVSIEILLDV